MTMNVYALAAEILGDLELSPDQRAQLRAIDYRHQLEVQRRMQARAGGEDADARAGTEETEPAAGDFAGRRALLIAGIRELLTPEQRATLDRR